MKTVTNHIREHLEKQIRPPMRPRPDLSELRDNQWSPRFERYMRNRLVIGAIRYETFQEKKTHNKYNIMDSIRRRLDSYILTGNQEQLVDAANLLMIEFECPTHPTPHFKSIDDGIHVEQH